MDLERCFRALAWRSGRAAGLTRPLRAHSSRRSQGDGHDIVGLTAGSALQDTWERRAAERGHRLNYRVRVPSFDAQLRLIERGVGVAMLPEATAQRAARTMAIDVLPLSDPYLIRHLLVCVRRLSALPVYAQRLVEALRMAHPLEVDSVRKGNAPRGQVDADPTTRSG